MDADERRGLVTVADYQFGRGAGAALFPEEEEPRVRRTSSGRPAQIHVGEGSEGHAADGSPGGEHLVSYGEDGRFRLGPAGGRRLCAELPAPAARVVVGDESEPFVRDGKNVFAKFVRDAGAELRPGDEVAVVHADGDLLAVGRAELPASAMADFGSGMAVKVRSGVR
ncbi:PUA domain-containing protein [Halosegnis marinus]|uniref:PUA domain-containing protein n=1 Tax=Halosegnis marinus TaxID=3034023 RepID=A0ABD5ZQ09_9EURY|nr:PUA domain-containing protein [Halosegnis sp. DT85]